MSPSIRPRRHAVRLTALALVPLLVACSACSSEQQACGDVERLIDSSSLHVLPGAEVTYEHSPPASGPHQLPAPSAGVHTEPIGEPLQVAAVEVGMVIVQYQPTVSPPAVAALEALAVADGVIVAPAGRAFDDDAEVAHTSWGRRQLCSSADLDAAAAFIEAYQGAVFIDHENGSD